MSKTCLHRDVYFRAHTCKRVLNSKFKNKGVHSIRTHLHEGTIITIIQSQFGHWHSLSFVARARISVLAKRNRNQNSQWHTQRESEKQSHTNDSSLESDLKCFVLLVQPIKNKCNLIWNGLTVSKNSLMYKYLLNRSGDFRQTKSVYQT